MVAGSNVVLIGGQAVAIWGAQLMTYLPAGQAPVTSRDVDFQGERSDVELAAQLLGGRLYVPRFDDVTPQTGKAVFVDSEGYERTLDFLAEPHGLIAEDVRRTAVPIRIAMEDGREIPLWVMHPERCLRSRVANTSLPGKRTALARRQLDAAIQLVPAFGRFLLDEGIDPRVVTKLNERVFELARYDKNAMRLWLEDGIDVLDALLADDRLPEAHRATRLPQIRAEVAKQRDHRRAVIARRGDG